MQTRGELTALFRSRDDAEDAAAELTRAGYDDGQIQIHDAGGSGGSTSSDNRTFMDRVKDFFIGEDPSTSDHAGFTGGALLTIFNPSPVAESVITQYGGRLQGGSTSTGDYDTARGSVDTARTGDAEQNLRLREERLQIDKQRVQGGEVRVGKDVVTEREQVDVPVMHEEVYVERRPVTEGQSVAEAGDISSEGEIVIPVMREEVSVDKRQVVTEEIRVGKRAVQETQTVGADVRKERARIENTGDVSPTTTTP
jgi:uncharacterized protein (TIGR02271 family)